MNARKQIGHVALAASAIFAVSGSAVFGPRAQTPNRGDRRVVLRSTIAFVSTRHDPTLDIAVDVQRALLGAEIYLMDGDGTNPRRLTENHYFDCFPALSPDGSKVVFDSNRLRTAGEPFNTSDLFVMNVDGTGQTPLVRGSSATWSPDRERIAFHASASGTGLPIISPRPGAATTDSDIFVLNVDKRRARPKNITNNPAAVGRPMRRTSPRPSNDSRAASPESSGRARKDVRLKGRAPLFASADHAGRRLARQGPPRSRSKSMMGGQTSV